MNKIVLLAIACSSFLSVWSQGKEKVVSSKVTEVVVFTAGAQVSHLANAQLKSGENIIRITGLPASLDPASIQVAGNNQYTIMSTKHQLIYSDGSMHPKVKELRDSIEELQYKISEINVQKEVMQQEKALLLANYSIKGSNAVITAEDITEVADMVKERMRVNGYKLLDLNAKENKHQQLLQKLQMRLSNIEGNNATNPSAIDIVLLVKNEARSDIKFSYFVSNAGWTPNYDLRSEDVNSPIDFSYKAKVFQSTGLDWEGVKLTISTGNPSVAGQLPVVNPWWLYMYDPAVMNQRNRKAKYRADEPAPAMMERQMSIAVDRGNDAMGSYNNGLTSASYTTMNTNVVNTEFVISVPYDIPSDNQGVEVVMQHESIKADYRYMCVPKLDPSAYLMAFMTNWSQYGLLAGESNIYFKGTFVGQGYIDPALANDTLQVNMGRDLSVVVNRTMVKDFCKSGSWAGKKWVTKAYDITVKNQKMSPIKMEIIDQIPMSNNSDLEVNAEEISGGVANKETGELRWLLDIGANQQVKKQLKFTVKYPKKMVVDL
jgi:uncharacterized protein (TIGR02231 family)